ncbi:MAG: hypothetical protein Q8930_04790 [Bacillota bacterium]|nr:hypothetical protein [Bacillota bacterium]
MKKFKAEAFDIMQYFYGMVHDPIIHSLIKFRGHIDERALIKAVTISADTIPLIRSCFNAEARHPYWEDRGFTGEDIVHVIESNPCIESQKLQLFASKIDMAKEPQLKIYIIREEDYDTLYILINHMVCDGAGFKEYLYLLAGLYTQFRGSMKNIIAPAPASRSTSQLFDGFNFIKRLGILFSKYDLSKQKEQEKYPLQGDENNPLFVTLEITKQELSGMKTYAKEHGATVNDLILTAYARVLYKRTGNERIIIPCPVDLRKYLQPGEKHGICNLTSNFICDVHLYEKDLFTDTLMQISSQMKVQKANKNCLKSVKMLELAIRLIPFRAMKKAFNKFFTIPVTSFSNLGVIDKSLLNFDNIMITYTYLTGAVKYAPYFQIAVSTFNDSCVLSSNLFGTPEDEKSIKEFLMSLKEELPF